MIWNTTQRPGPAWYVPADDLRALGRRGVTGFIGFLWFLASLVVAHFVFYMIISFWPDSQFAKALTAINL